MPAPKADPPRCDVPGCGTPAAMSTDGTEKDAAVAGDLKTPLNRPSIKNLNLCGQHPRGALGRCRDVRDW